MPNLPPVSRGSAGRGASTSPCRSRRSSPSSAELRHPEAVAVDQAGDLRVLLFPETLLEAREHLLLFHMRVFMDQGAELAHLFEPVRRIRPHLVQFVNECLDVAVLIFE